MERHAPTVTLFKNWHYKSLGISSILDSKHTGKPEVSDWKVVEIQ